MRYFVAKSSPFPMNSYKEIIVITHIIKWPTSHLYTVTQASNGNILLFCVVRMFKYSLQEFTKTIHFSSYTNVRAIHITLLNITWVTRTRIHIIT